jgi:TonB-dependent receptor
MTDAGLVDMTDDNFLAGDYKAGQFVSNEYLGNLNLSNSALFEKTDVPAEYAGGNFNATEKIIAGYAMLTQNVGKKLTLLAGVRLENTSLDYNAFAFDDETEKATPTSGSDDYLNVLPAIHAKYNVTDQLLVRAAWTNTIARPNYFDIAPYRILEVEDNRIEVGNPDLEPTKSMNFDLMAENYFESIGLVSAGVFYKDLTDFIFAYREDDYTEPGTGTVFDRYTQPRNGASATIFGFEIGAQRQLDFLPSFLKNFSLYANYTYTKSEVDGLPMEGREDEKLGLPGTAKNMINGSISYDTKDFTVRLSVNHTSDYVDEFGDEAFEDRYYDKQTFVDMNASYALTDQFRIYAEANNLTNQPLRYYQGVSGHTMQAEYYNMRFNFGVKFDL